MEFTFIIMEKIDNLDRQILEIISQNARIPFKDVAAECGVSRAAIHQRVQRLIDLGVIVGSGSPTTVFDVKNPSIPSNSEPMVSFKFSLLILTASYHSYCSVFLFD